MHAFWEALILQQICFSKTNCLNFAYLYKARSSFMQDCFSTKAVHILLSDLKRKLKASLYFNLHEEEAARSIYCLHPYCVRVINPVCSVLRKSVLVQFRILNIVTEYFLFLLPCLCIYSYARNKGCKKERVLLLVLHFATRDCQECCLVCVQSLDVINSAYLNKKLNVFYN